MVMSSFVMALLIGSMNGLLILLTNQQVGLMGLITEYTPIFYLLSFHSAFPLLYDVQHEL